LVALGLWTDGSGKRHILDWEVVDQEGKVAWERLVQCLWERGVKLESGLQAVVRDGTEGLEQAIDVVHGSALMKPRCIFHTLRNVSDKCLGLAREDKQQFLDQARTVYQAQNAQETQERLATFA
jgi:transposase-like protein